MPAAALRSMALYIPWSGLCDIHMRYEMRLRLRLRLSLAVICHLL
jgi:hypothetical protein